MVPSRPVPVTSQYPTAVLLCFKGSKLRNPLFQLLQVFQTLHHQCVSFLIKYLSSPSPRGGIQPISLNKWEKRMGDGGGGDLRTFLYPFLRFVPPLYRSIPVRQKCSNPECSILRKILSNTRPVDCLYASFLQQTWKFCPNFSLTW